MIKILKIVLVIITASLLESCDKTLLGDLDRPPTLEENIAIPPHLNDGWETGSLDNAHIDSKSINDLVSLLQNDDRNIHGILIARNGKLVHESYFGGWHRAKMQGLISCTKSVNSALVGIAIDKHYLVDVHQKIFDFFPAYSNLRTPQNTGIEIKDLLTMSSGFEWRQSPNAADDPTDDENRLSKSNDGFGYILSKPLVSTPGTYFNYNSGNSDLLAGIVQQSSGMDAIEFAKKNLFYPLNITQFSWGRQLNGYANAGYGLVLLPRDMLKIGQLYLDHGMWKGNRIISSQWIDESTQTQIGTGSTGIGYGYQWWTRSWNINGNVINTIQAQGNGGQVICIVPSLNTVIVLTGGNFGTTREAQLPYGFLQGYILPAIQ